MDGETQAFIIGTVIGLVIGVIVMSGITDIYRNKEIKVLGKSICEEEYGMDYESYIDKTLRCKLFTESYDGIKVEVPKVMEVD